jgi:Protein of unknown function (DUF998)
VSRLASPGEPWALAARSSFVAYGLLVLAGVSVLRHYAGRCGRTLAGCLAFYGLACVVVGVAPKDQPGAPHTAVSEVHVAACVLAGARHRRHGPGRHLRPDQARPARGRRDGVAHLWPTGPE